MPRGGRFLVSLGMTNKNLFFGVRLFPFGHFAHFLSYYALSTVFASCQRAPKESLSTFAIFQSCLLPAPLRWQAPLMGKLRGASFSPKKIAYFWYFFLMKRPVIADFRVASRRHNSREWKINLAISEKVKITRCMATSKPRKKARASQLCGWNLE